MVRDWPLPSAPVKLTEPGGAIARTPPLLVPPTLLLAIRTRPPAPPIVIGALMTTE